MEVLFFLLILNVLQSGPKRILEVAQYYLILPPNYCVNFSTMEDKLHLKTDVPQVQPKLNMLNITRYIQTGLHAENYQVRSIDSDYWRTLYGLPKMNHKK